MNKTSNISTQIRKGTLDFFVLAILKDTPRYPREVIETLNHHGLNLVEGTIYPLFLRLYKNNLVAYEWIESAGHPRKYYSLTPDGLIALKQYEHEWALLNHILTDIKKGSTS